MIAPTIFTENSLTSGITYHIDRFMNKQQRAGKVQTIAPRPDEMVERIHRLAKESKNVAFSNHAEERMDERGISDLDALRVLRSGCLSGSIEPGAYEGEWKCKIVAPIKGRREVGVVTILVKNRKLRVKTVEWEDLR